MGLTRTEHYTEKQNQIAAIAKALGHPARVAIVEFLLKSEHCICSDIVEELPLAQATISQHLRELKNCGFIKGNIEGNAICYCIDEKVLDQFRKYFNSTSEKLQTRKCC
ncbi:MAG TPA: metalloregulator ArsR/SmtB family transcription factor [Chitinophagaceae bacterium]|nr:metalloregulator ArsR/SmtB family transcription factor [Chitinophagaceae bacterium]HNF71443.1 metalloregulator ArsR/SmtB family transcription factor [Chitinophagaceae bacterium]